MITPYDIDQPDEDRKTFGRCPVCNRLYRIRYTLAGEPVFFRVDVPGTIARTCTTRGCGVQLAEAVTVAEKSKGKP